MAMTRYNSCHAQVSRMYNGRRRHQIFNVGACSATAASNTIMSTSICTRPKLINIHESPDVASRPWTSSANVGGKRNISDADVETTAEKTLWTRGEASAARLEMRSTKTRAYIPSAPGNNLPPSRTNTTNLGCRV